MTPEERTKTPFGILDFLALLAIVAVIIILAIPGLVHSRRAYNERGPSASLKTLATAEIDFRANDRDNNRINDFWTGDVAGLYALISYYYDEQKAAMVAGSMIKLIDGSIACADAFSQSGEAIYKSADGRSFQYGVKYEALPQRGSKAGYWFYALDADNSSGILEDYQTVSDGIADAAVHNVQRFGFGTFPDTYGVGRSIYMINESAIVIRAALPATYARPNPAQIPPRARPAGYENWPSDTDIKKFSRMD